MKKYICVKTLEEFYLSQIKEKDGEKFIPVELEEKMMLLEIYKALCECGDDNPDDRDNGRNC